LRLFQPGGEGAQRFGKEGVSGTGGGLRLPEFGDAACQCFGGFGLLAQLFKEFHGTIFSGYLQHGSGGCCQGSLFLADGPHAEPPWLFLLGWYPSGFMMQYKDNEISVDWLSEIVSRKERRERKMHWKRGRAKNAGNAK